MTIGRGNFFGDLISERPIDVFTNSAEEATCRFTVDAMTTKHLFLAAILAVCCGATMAQTSSSRYIRVAELQIDPAQSAAFAAATREVGQASVHLEEGCLALYAVADKENPAFVRVFEIYRDSNAYQAHLQTAHFKKFRDSTNAMVTSRKFIDATPISLATKPGVAP